MLSGPPLPNGKPSLIQQRWANLQKRMPQAELDAIAAEPGYAHLKGNSEALALEWFARQAEARPELLNKPSLVSVMWGNFKESVVDLMTRMGLEPPQGKDLDTQVMALLQRARQSAVKGGSGPNAGSGALGQDLQFSNTTRRGVKRNNPKDWRETMLLWDSVGMEDLLSPANRARIKDSIAPIVDDAWIVYHPEDSGLRGQKISMHHVEGLPLTVPLPYSRHIDAHRPGGFGRNPGGVGSQLPLYPADPSK